jgi:ankyrin repeat protein
LLAPLALSPAGAHETDNFTLPAQREFADMGPVLTEWAYVLIERAVDKTNADLKERIDRGAKPEDLADFYSPDHLVGQVNGQIGWAMTVINNLEGQLHSDKMRDRYPGLLPCYRQPFNDVYSGAGLPIDPRQFIRLFFSSTFKAYGVHMGTDKIGHFTDMGMNYLHIYRSSRHAGKSEEQAMHDAVYDNLNNPVLSEGGFLGFVTAGSWSNADLVSNYTGLLFWRNINEPVMLKGELRPPMIIRDGAYLKIAPHVRRDSDFFSYFISDHFDEALNPSVYDPTLRGGVRNNVEHRAPVVLQRHADEFGNRRPREWFERKVQELSTYWGQDYGHKGSGEELVSISNTCFFKPKPDAAANDRDRTGNTPLHYYATVGDVQKIKEYLGKGADVNARVVSDEPYSSEWGNTPLHYAARDGQLDAATVLLDNNADANAASTRGQRPLHRAAGAGQTQLAELLLSRKAIANAPDAMGRTPLHWAAAAGELEIANLLIDRGASVAALDLRRRTPLHYAAQTGDARLIDAMLKRGARADAADDAGVTPVHLAAQRDDAGTLLVLLQAKAPANVADDFGRTPLHDAARDGDAESVRRLLDAGAQPKATDAYGLTPLHLAAEQARVEVCAMLLDRGADPNAVTTAGASPLHQAAIGGHKPTIRLLLARGGNPTAKNKQGQTPADLVRAQHRDEYVSILSSASHGTGQ